MELKTQPDYQDFHLEGVNHISPAEAYNLVSEEKALLIDVRDKSEYDVEHIGLPNVRNYPMTEMLKNLDYLPPDAMLITMDTTGERGVKVANLLNMQRFKQVANLDGGIVQWKRENFPTDDILPDECSECKGCS